LEICLQTQARRRRKKKGKLEGLVLEFKSNLRTWKGEPSMTEAQARRRESSREVTGEKEVRRVEGNGVGEKRAIYGSGETPG
jgi:hypothetical protein